MDNSTFGITIAVGVGGNEIEVGVGGNEIEVGVGGNEIAVGVGMTGDPGRKSANVIGVGLATGVGICSIAASTASATLLSTSSDETPDWHPAAAIINIKPKTIGHNPGVLNM